MQYLKLSIFFVFSFIQINMLAQTIEPAENIEKNVLQFEVETSYTKQEKGIEKMESFTIPNVLIRYGLSHKFELQIGAPLIKEKLHSNNTLIHTNHLVDDIQFGLQYNLFKEKNLLPQTALMVRSVIPSSNITFEKVGYITALNFTNNITNNFSFNYNIGTLFSPNATTLGYYILNATYTQNKLHFFIENIAEVAFNRSPIQNIGVGFGVNIAPKFTIDFSTTQGINHNLFAVGAIFIYHFDI